MDISFLLLCGKNFTEMCYPRSFICVISANVAQPVFFWWPSLSWLLQLVAIRNRWFSVPNIKRCPRIYTITSSYISKGCSVALWSAHCLLHTQSPTFLCTLNHCIYSTHVMVGQYSCGGLPKIVHSTDDSRLLVILHVTCWGASLLLTAWVAKVVRLLICAW